MEDKSKLEYTIDKDEKKSYGQITKELYHDDWYVQEELFQKFKNSRKTGIIDRIEKYTGLHMEWYEDNDNDKSDMLRLVKYLMQIESEYPLLEILSQPTLSKISFSRQYDNYDYELELENIRHTIKESTSEGYADRSDYAYEKVLYLWLNLINEIFGLVTDSYFHIIMDYQPDDNLYKAVEQFVAKEEIVSKIKSRVEAKVKKKKKENNKSQSEIFREGYSRIKEALNDIYFSAEQEEMFKIIKSRIKFILENIGTISEIPDTEDISEIGYKHNAIDTFYNEFNRYKIRCFMSDGNPYENSGCEESARVQDFIIKYNDMVADYDFFDKMERTLAGRLNKSGFEESYGYEMMRDVIQRGVPVELTDADIRYAVKNLKAVAQWWKPEYCDETSLNLAVAITVLQELAYLRNTKKEFKGRFNRHESAKTFSAIIAKPETADEAVKSVITSQLNYRFIVNILGKKEDTELLKTIIDKLWKIFDILTMYKNIEDMTDACGYLYNTIEFALRFVTVPGNSIEEFSKMISNKVAGKYELNLKNTVYLQHILHENAESLDILAEKIINKLIEHEEKTFTYYPKINKWMDAVMVFESEAKTIEFKSVSLSTDGESIHRMKEIGLHKMCGE